MTSITLRLSQPPALPAPHIHGQSHHQRTSDPTLATLITELSSTPPRTILQAIYQAHSRCQTAPDLQALRHTLNTTNAHPLVICTTDNEPLPRATIPIIQALSTRFGSPLITTTNITIIAQLLKHNITPILPTTSQQALQQMASSLILLVHGTYPCAIGARLAKGVVYYTNHYYDFVTIHGYQWLPDHPARLDGFDRSYKAVLNGLGNVEESCCTFIQGICNPTNNCTALILGLPAKTPCNVLHICPNISTACNKRRAISADVLLIDLQGDEFTWFQQLQQYQVLPKQIVVRVQVFATARKGPLWRKSHHGWTVSRDVVESSVKVLRNLAFTLVHRVDDPTCDTCALVTFIRS